MRKLFLTVTVLLVAIFGVTAIGVAEETPIQDIPNQHIVFYARSPFGIIPIIIPKGHLSPDNEGVYWQTIENYKKRIEMNRKFQEYDKKSLEEYKKKHPEMFGKKQPI